MSSRTLLLHQLNNTLQRRRMVNALILGSAAEALGLMAADARRKRKGKGKKKGKGKGKRRCQPPTASALCGGGCGTVSDSCGGTVVCRCPDGQCCNGSGICGACRVFLSSKRHNGNFSGLTGADVFCQDLASTAHLPGEYMAWLSDATASPATRFVRATSAYVRVDGITVASDWNHLVGGSLDFQILLDEAGQQGAQGWGIDGVWTNTLVTGVAGGQRADGHCANWTSHDTTSADGGNTGQASAGQTWTAWSTHVCAFNLPVYCFQQR